MLNDCKLRFMDLSSVEQLKCKLLHCRLGHRSLGAVVRSTANGGVKSILAGSIQSNSSGFCECCALSSITARPIPKLTTTRASSLYHTISSDLKGPFKVASHGGFKYMMSFIDDYSRFSHVFFLRYKSSALDVFKQFYNDEISGKNYVLNVLKFDNGTTYRNTAFKQF